VKPEPLTKGKRFVLDIRYPMSLSKFPEGKPSEKYIVFLSDVKSAVNWLLKEIEKEKKKIENLKPIYNDYGNYEDWTCPICKIHFKEETKAYEHVEWEKRELRKTKGKMLNWFEDLIKKAFEGVVDGKNS